MQNLFNFTCKRNPSHFCTFFSLSYSCAILATHTFSQDFFFILYCAINKYRFLTEKLQSMIAKYYINFAFLFYQRESCIINFLEVAIKSELYPVKEMFVFAFSRFWHLVFFSLFFVLSFSFVQFTRCCAAWLTAKGVKEKMYERRLS